MYESLRQILVSGDYSVVESFELPARPAIFRPVPRFLFESAVGQHLEGEVSKGSGLWRHQAQAIELLGDGRNVVIPTGTASGKSLIFRSVAFHRILTDPHARVLVFYPLKALASDQLRGWRAMAGALGLPDQAIGRIDGSVRDMKERDRILETSRVVLMTPDVCHAWLMSRLAMPVVKQFLRSVALVIMDEAHTLEGVFGSNFAFLIRRLLVAREWLLKEDSTERPLQFVAATATISNPQELLRSLTGSEFELIDETLDGSPRASRICAHIAAPAGEELQLARALQTELLRNSRNGGFITFVDSRKAVESLARSSQQELTDAMGGEAVMPCLLHTKCWTQSRAFDRFALVARCGER
ncbi:MAG: DEAD/DEAH box helicase [Woeseiaceae bacterium]